MPVLLLYSSRAFNLQLSRSPFLSFTSVFFTFPFPVFAPYLWTFPYPWLLGVAIVYMHSMKGKEKVLEDASSD